MFTEQKTVMLHDGQWVVLRSPEPSDAERILEHLRITSGETHFMGRYPEEVAMSVEEEEAYLRDILADSNDFMLLSLVEDELAGVASVCKVSHLLKFRHRGELGISVKQQFCGRGVGSVMLEAVLETARKAGFDQVELNVFADNERAIHVYKKAGFIQCGLMPRAYKLKDGIARDELEMVYLFADEEERG